MRTRLTVLYEDNHLLAINKPAGLPTMGVARDRASAVVCAKNYLKHKYKKPGNVYIGVVSRLDAPVSGVLLLARTSKSAARLNQQFKTGAVEKIYWALVAGNLQPATDEWSDYVFKDEAAQRMRVVASARSGAQKAVLSYRRLSYQRGDDETLVEVRLATGRKHQIRVQFSSRGLPIAGDTKYSSRLTFPRGIALHARRLVIEHPVKKDRLELVAAVPSYWPRWVKEH